MSVTKPVPATKNVQLFCLILLAFIASLTSYLFLLIHQQGNNFEALSQAAYGVLDGHPHWITYQNRLLGPYSVLLISKLGFSYLTACKLFYLLGIITQIFLLYFLLIKSACSESKSLAWVVLYCFLFISYQGWWFYTWDSYDALLFTLFAYFVLNKKPTLYFVCLFFVALLNRESALFIALFLLVKGISINCLKKSIRNDSVGTSILGVFLLILGVVWTHVIRTWLFISSPDWILALPPPEHGVLGNRINLGNFYELVFGNGTSRDALWVLGSVMLLCNTLGRQITREQASLGFIYGVILLSLLVFGAVGETRMYISLFPLFIFLMATPTIPPKCFKV